MKSFWFYFISFFIFLFDQLIKSYVRLYKPALEYIYYATNTGAAFGIFKGGNIILAILTFLVISLIIYYFVTAPKLFKNKLIFLSASLILGGALGNFVDRITFGHVIDYIRLGNFPIFNLADIALTLGIFILIITYFKDE